MISLIWNMGLGDAIACAAIVAKLAQKDEVTIPCWTHNEVSVRSFFINYPQVKVLPMSNDLWLQEKSAIRIIPDHRTVVIGNYNKAVQQGKDEDFVQWFYRQAGMTMEDKERYCPIWNACKDYTFNEAGYTNRIFVHDDIDRGFNIHDPEKRIQTILVRPKKLGYSILFYADNLVKSEEIHCIDSSFLHLAEALNVKGKKFYHKYARPNSTDFKYIKGWEVIE